MNWKNLLNDQRIRKSTREDTSRNHFESDFGRTIFSPATRRMHDKTQVFPLSADDHIHTRLTHSMEVMAIGHSLGIRICEDPSFQKLVGKDRDIFREIPVILKNACLLHDIGNPPFGHFGETVIQNYFKKHFSSSNAVTLTDKEKEDFIFFDGNAQGFRIITKLQILNDDCGLNLTYATLGAFLKYPNYGEIGEKISNKKRGIFQSEKDYMHKVADACGTIIDSSFVRHPLSYLMEAADSICYSVMDIEDGFNKGWYKFDYIKQSLSHIDGIPEIIKDVELKLNGYGNESTSMVNFRIALINRLVNLAVKNFLTHIDLIMEGSYNNELIYDDNTKLAEALKTFCIKNIFPQREITTLELTGHSVLTGLLDYYIEFIFKEWKDYTKRAAGLISESVLRAAYLENKLPANSTINDLNNYYKLRVIVDFISGMTDQFALNHYQKLSGQKIN
jgi:dGTPase